MSKRKKIKNNKKIMIVTEQPYQVGKVLKKVSDDMKHDPLGLGIQICKGISKCWGNYKKNINPFSFDYNFTFTFKSIGSKSQFLQAIKALFDFFLINNYQYYWTHYVRCPGNFKNKTDIVKHKFEVNTCADEWIEKEIKKYKPTHIITFGYYAGSYLWGKVIERMLKYDGSNDLKCKFNQTIPLLVLPHPSGQNKSFNKYRKPTHKPLINRVKKYFVINP